MLDALDIKSERPDCDGSDDGGEGYRGWARHPAGLEEEQRGDERGACR